jgi:cell division protein FtsB
MLVGNVIIGERGLVSMVRATDEFEKLSDVVAELRVENQLLREEMRRLRDEPRTIEELARGELGLIQSGEKLFIVADRTIGDTVHSATGSATNETVPPELLASEP